MTMPISGVTGLPPALAPAKSASVRGPDAGGSAFSQRLESAIASVDQAQHTADGQLAKLAAGDDVDLHGTMIALEEADITLRTMVTVRDKVVDAYQQVMNMQI